MDPQFIPYSNEYKDDLKKLVSANLQFHVINDTFGIYGEHEDYADYAFELIMERLENLECVLYIVTVEDEIAGFGNAYVKAATKEREMKFQNKKIGHIGRFFLYEKYRGKGIGGKLFAELESFLREKKCEFITLAVNGTNPRAHELYVKNGYHDHSIEMIKPLEKPT